MERSCHGYLRVAKTISRWAVGLISLKWDKMNNWNMVLEAGQQHHLYSHQVNIWRYIWLKSPDRGKHKYSDPIFQKSWAKQIGIKKKQQQYKNNKNTISQHWSWGRYTNISISTLSCVVTWLWKDNEFDGVFYIQPQQKKPILCLQKPNTKCDVAQKVSYNTFYVSITVIRYFYYNFLVCFSRYGYIQLCSN